MPPCPVIGNSPPVIPFQCYLVKCPLPPSLPVEPKPRESQPQAIRWPMASYTQWSIRLFYLLGILPTMPNVSLINLFMTTVALLFTMVAESRVGKAQAKRLEEDLRNHRNWRHIYPLLADAAAVAVDMLYSLLLWPTQWTWPWHHSNAAAYLVGAHISKPAHDEVSTSWCPCAVL